MHTRFFLLTVHVITGGCNEVARQQFQPMNRVASRQLGREGRYFPRGHTRRSAHATYRIDTYIVVIRVLYDTTKRGRKNAVGPRAQKLPFLVRISFKSSDASQTAVPHWREHAMLELPSLPFARRTRSDRPVLLCQTRRPVPAGRSAWHLSYLTTLNVCPRCRDDDRRSDKIQFLKVNTLHMTDCNDGSSRSNGEDRGEAMAARRGGARR